MAKQILISVMEELLGEYILNISRENLKIAVLRGKIKLENVQLDGDLIGSHILGAVGLSGFGVLSCWAKSLKIVVPWNALEKEPTRFEIRGMHLLCVPLLPSTATTVHGSGTPLDPRCSLRTRAKRSTLARFERNFFAGRIPGEGPPPRRRRPPTQHKPQQNDDINGSNASYFNDTDEAFGSNDEESDEQMEGDEKDIPWDNRPEWKKKLQAKFMGNIEASVHDVHLRCEVPERGLDFCQTHDNTTGRDINDSGDLPADLSAFSFGFTLESVFIKAANHRWETGNMYKNVEKTPGGVQDPDPPPNDGRLFRVVEVNNLAMYWDNNPSVRISGMRILNFDGINVTPHKAQVNVAAAMKSLIFSQDIDADLLSLLEYETSSPRKTASVPPRSRTPKKHDFCIDPFSLKFRATLSSAHRPGPRRVSAELLPCMFEINLNPHQYVQYTRLRSVMFAQQRFDTMLHQRPKERPTANPKAWWKYAIACVTTRPNSRPWIDVRRIVRNRRRYIELVTKKLLNSSDGSGYHGGLTERESLFLLELEDLLPIEALMAFHLIALRRVYDITKRGYIDQSMGGGENMYSQSLNRRKSRSKTSLKKIRRALGGGGVKGRRNEKSESDGMEDQLLASSSHSYNGGFSSFSGSNGPGIGTATPMWVLTFLVHDAGARARLLQPRGKPIAELNLVTGAVIRLLGAGKREVMFDVNELEIVDCLHSASTIRPVEGAKANRILWVDFAEEDTISSHDNTREREQWVDELGERLEKLRIHPGLLKHGDDSVLPSVFDSERVGKSFDSQEKMTRKASNSFDDEFRPPSGVVCRVLASSSPMAHALSLTANPGNLIWNKHCFDAVIDFFSIRSPDMKSVLRGQLRNAATPLAHKAQLALTSPSSISVLINVAAPKVWVPIASDTSDGALFLDAGKFNMSLSKPQRIPNINWEVAASEIQVTLVRGVTGRQKPEGKAPLVLPLVEANSKEEIPVVRPVSIHASASFLSESKIGRSFLDNGSTEDKNSSDPIRNISVIVSPISLNLVDVDEFARAIGKWYADGIVRMRKRAARLRGKESLGVDPVVSSLESTEEGLDHGLAPRRSLTILVEKIEMALEGYASPGIMPSDATAHVPHHNVVLSRKRTYLVELFRLKMESSTETHRRFSLFSVEDVSVVQEKSALPSGGGDPIYKVFERAKRRLDTTEGSHLAVSPLKTPTRNSGNARSFYNEGQSVSRNSSFCRTDSEFSVEASSSERKRSSVMSATHLHDSSRHLDEIDVDIDTVIMRVTPVSLNDFARGLRKLFELIQLTTREMEREVHEQGRIARKREKERKLQLGDEKSFMLVRPVSPMSYYASEANTEILGQPDEFNGNGEVSDSSIIFKVTLTETIVLAGSSVPSRQSSIASSGVVQIASSTLLMFQSIENADATGSKTLHVSIDNLAAAINKSFERVPQAELPPTIGPAAAEFRIVYGTENLGCVVSQEISLDCDSIKACLTVNDIKVMSTIVTELLDRLRFLARIEMTPGAGYGAVSLGKRRPAMIRYQKRGTGIATKVRLELQTFSFVLLRPLRSRLGARPIFDLNGKYVKGHLEGCMSAFSGECNAIFSVNFFNSDVGDWEHALEPFNAIVSIEQMPNDMVLRFTTSDVIQINLTGMLLSHAAELEFDLQDDGWDVSKIKNDKFPSGPPRKDDGFLSAPSKMSTHGLRRATEAHTVTLVNQSGVDIIICPMAEVVAFDCRQGEKHREIDITRSKCVTVKNGESAILDSSFGAGELQDIRSRSFPLIALTLAPSSEPLLARREALFDLPITTISGKSSSLHKLEPIISPKDAARGRRPMSESYLYGRGSPETAFSDTSSVLPMKSIYDIEPVVEWCMQNQRLRSSTVDVFSLEKGIDLLSSSAWSPGDDKTQTSSKAHFNETSGVGARQKNTSNWLRPYLKNDSPEWTDMTCILRMARERVMLPDNNWIWVNNWTVDLSGSYGETTDADGWEYEADFETFSRTRRFYKRGDCCRRRRWTRTRMIRPPKLEDPYRPLSIVWETEKVDNGNFQINVRSSLTIHNSTSTRLFFFGFCHSWESDIFLDTVEGGMSCPVRIKFASATYLRIGIQKEESDTESQTSNTLSDFFSSERLMIVPTSHTSSLLIRTSVFCEDSLTRKHFVVHVKCTKGVTDIVIDPVLRVVNLLPCVLDCQVGEIAQKDNYSKNVERNRGVLGNLSANVCIRESKRVETGKECTIEAADPHSRPYISLRVPGYKWSSWQRLINRKSNSFTWQPSIDEEDYLFQPNKSDAEHAEEYKTTVWFSRVVHCGNPLVLIMSIEVGHCPIVRLYAQYWILDKTGFGCQFTDGFTDLMGTTPDGESSRRSHLPPEESRDPEIKKDMKMQGHQWSIGMSGMSMFFSRKERIALAIESGAGDHRIKSNDPIRSNWVSPIDVSNVLPKTVFSLDEYGGQKRFELALSVTLCPTIFARTKLITLFPRYQIVNLMDRDLFVAQDGCLAAETLIPCQASVPFHLEVSSMPPKVRLCSASYDNEFNEDVGLPWTNGCIQLDKVGITSMRLPVPDDRLTMPMVVQAEVRLAAKHQSSAVVIVLWSTTEASNPLYLLKNRTSRTILCSQAVDEDHSEQGTVESQFSFDACSGGGSNKSGKTRAPRRKKNRSLSSNNTPTRQHAIRSTFSGIECGTDLGPIIGGFLGLGSKDEFVWTIPRGLATCFGFDDPERAHALEWACAENGQSSLEEAGPKSYVEVDAMGSSSILVFPDGSEVHCHIRAEHSTKLIEFTEVKGRSPLPDSLTEKGIQYQEMLNVSPGSELIHRTSLESSEEDEDVAFSLRLDLPVVTISVIDNATPGVSGREILFAQFDKWMVEFSQSREGYHELEVRLMSLQIDNHVHKCIHPVLALVPRLDAKEPFLHLSAVRRLQPTNSTHVFRYAALRILEINIFLDRRTAETVARFIQPLRKVRETNSEDPHQWLIDTTKDMARKFAKPDRRAPRDTEQMVLTANTGRIYFEQLHLHPVRIGLTFTQEWMDWNPATEGLMIFQFIRGMASIANAPLTFTSFVVGHAFESPQALLRIISSHYSSQLTKQIFGILGSLAILGAPADFLSNVGTGVRDFFYEPINGMVHGPAQFIEGLEAGTQSLARGVFVGVVRGAANVTEAVNSNLAGLTADDDFIDERKAHQRMLTDAMSRGANKTIGHSLYLAGASVARGVKSGAMGIVEQPTMYASKHGPVGFVKGVGKALVGAIVKPVVGVGDAAVLVMNHVSEATSDKTVIPKIPKRLRRALPRLSGDRPHCVHLIPYNERAAKAQKIVTGGESLDDIYLGHVNIPSHLVIASDQFLWAIDRGTREPWCVSWEEISHFGMLETGMRITVFSQNGVKSHFFKVDSAVRFAELYQLLSMQVNKMGNCSSDPSHLESSMFSGGLENISKHEILGVRAKQVNHVFGSCNKTRIRLSSSVKDEIDVIEQCFDRVKALGSESPTFFKTLDEEAWNLVSSWGQVFSGLSSRRCLAAGIINGTGGDIQIKSTKLVEGGSPCYTIPTKEFDSNQGIVHPGGAIIFFGWGVVPNLLQVGNVFMNIETNAFVSDLSDRKSRFTFAMSLPGFQVGFLEKSYDESGWWAKYWLLVRKP